MVTLHVPQTPQTRHLIDAERLAQMKDDAVLINLARGQAVDIDALHAALSRAAGCAAPPSTCFRWSRPRPRTRSSRRCASWTT